MQRMEQEGTRQRPNDRRVPLNDPARIFQWLAKALGWTGADRDYGLNTRGSLARYDRDSQSWKTSEPLLFGDLTGFSGRLPKSGMMRSGRIYGPAMWERPTGESESGLSPIPMAEMWPTPDVRGFTNEGALKMLVEVAEDREEFSGMAYRAGMKNKEALWPTPMASDADKNSKNRDRYLPGAVQKYPTPTANDAKNTLTESQRGRGTLTAPLVESLWPTPRTAGMCGGTGAWAKLKEKAAGIEEARQMGAGNGGRLSPDWVERLMGYPDGWTDIEQENVNMKNCYPAAWFDGSWDTIPRVVSGVKNRTGRLICLGNAVVPQIPMLIWQMIKEFL